MTRTPPGAEPRKAPANNTMRQLLQIDIEGILRKRIPSRKQKFIPGFLYGALSRLIHQDELNAMLRAGWPAQGSEFARIVLDHLSIEVEIVGEENFPADDRRVVFASNHPLGGLDGIALIAVLGRRYGDEIIRFLVNDLLMNVEPLSNVFLPINKYGGQALSAEETINAEYASGRQMVIFPAGLVSRLHPGGEVKDLKWQKAFVQKAIENDRDIVPVRFVALNRKRFYRLAKWRKKLGIKVNIEQATLPAELCAARGKRFRIVIGKPLSVSDLKSSGKSYVQLAADIRELVYILHKAEKI